MSSMICIYLSDSQSGVVRRGSGKKSLLHSEVLEMGGAQDHMENSRAIRNQKMGGGVALRMRPLLAFLHISYVHKGKSD